MILRKTGNIEFIGIKMTDKSIIEIKSLEEAKELNQKGWNIYQILNSFKDFRRKENIVSFDKMGFDIDTKVGVKSKIKELMDVYKIYPSEINETFKGFHVIFNIAGITTIEEYEGVYNKFNAILGGDTNMRSTTGILKVAGFIDYKDGRNFEIKNIFKRNIKNDMSKFVEKNEFEDLEKMVLNEKEETKKEIVKEKKEYIRSEIEEIDGREFIDEVESYFGIDLQVVGNGFKNSDGLKLYLNPERNMWEIRDFAGKVRFGNRNFLFNWVFKDEEKDEVLFGKVNKFLFDVYGITLRGVKKNKIMVYNTFLDKRFENDEFDLLLKDYNKSLIKKEKTEFIKLICGINYLRKEIDGKIVVGENDLLDLFGYAVNSRNKLNLRRNILILSNLNFLNKSFDVDGNERVEFKRYFELTMIKDKKNKNKIMYEIKYLRNDINNIGIDNLNVLKIKDEGKFALALKINSLKTKYGTMSIKKDEFENIYGVCDKNKRKFLNDLKKDKIIKDFTFGERIYIK